METIETIIAAVRAAVNERDAKRDALGERIARIARDAMGACGLEALHAPLTPEQSSAAWTLTLGRVHARVSQWGDGSQPSTNEEPCVLVGSGGDRGGDLRVVGAVPDCSIHDGRNMWRQRGPAHLGAAPRDDAELVRGPVARPATVATLRQIARDLPAVVAAALAAREAAVRAQAAAAVEAEATLGGDGC